MNAGCHEAVSVRRGTQGEYVFVVKARLPVRAANTSTPESCTAACFSDERSYHKGMQLALLQFAGQTLDITAW